MADSAQQLALMRRALSSVDPRTSDITGDPNAAQAIVDYPGQLIREGQDNNRQYLADVMAASKNPFDPSNDDAKQRIADRSLAVAASVGENAPKPKALAMDEASRMARAKEMGFDPKTTWYHGTPEADISAFDPYASPRDAHGEIAGFFTKKPKFADKFTERQDPSQIEELGEAPNIIPTHLNTQKPFDYEDASQVKALIEAIPKAERSKIISGSTYRSLKGAVAAGDWSILEHPRVIKSLKELGHDAMHVSEEGVKNIAVFKPNQIRSKFAEFDPSKADSGNISAGIGIGGALGSAALADRLKPKEQSY